MDAAGHRGKSASISSSSNSTSTASTTAYADVAGPFVLRDGRPYLRDAPYPLPCDLAELQRQNLHTLLATKAFGLPLCSPNILQQPPQKALEIACGSGYWSSLAHDHLASLGHSKVSFTGIDVVNFAPDLNKQGINWRYVQHDVRHVPFPFEDEEFDLVMVKDISMVCPQGTATQRLLDEAMRVLRGGGTLEIWESDHTIRSIMPHPAPPPGRNRVEQERAVATGTFLISPMTPFTQPENSFLRSSNAWIEEALDRRRLSANSCTRVAQALLQEPESLCDVAYRRIAIPMGKVWWDRKTGAMPEAVVVSPQGEESDESEEEDEDEDESDEDSDASTEDPASLSQTALAQYVQMIESLEPFLKDVSGKNQEEWQRWWTWMMEDLLLRNGASSGECLEIGAWWAKKVYN